MSRATTLDAASGQVAVFSARAPDKESANEDAAAVIFQGPDDAVLLVADGVGGQPAGQQASEVTLHILRDALEDASRKGVETRDAILNGIEAANEAVIGLGSGAATTLAVVEIRENIVRPYHIGDSMIIVTGQRGRLKLQTISHSPVGYAVEAGFLDEEEAIHHDERHLVSNVIGNVDMRIEIGSAIELAQKDTLILATDGLFDNLSVTEIIEIIRKGRLKPAADRLARSCIRRMSGEPADRPGKPDDLTFILFRRGARRSNNKERAD